MSEIGYAALGIIPSFDGFQGKLEQGTAKHMVAAGKTGGSKFGNAAGESAGKRFGLSFKKVAVGLLTGAAAIKIKDFLGDSVAEARDSQKVGALTVSVIKATGKAAKVSAKHVGDLATAISNKTGMDDETIQSGANMLLTFKNIRNEQGKNNKIFDQSVGILTDLSAAMGTEPKQAAIQLGKALNDPITGVTALTRVGVTFTAEQKEQIKTLVEHGKTMDAQKIILHELSSEFGGAAAAQSTWGDKASVAWGNFKEGIGTSLLPVIDTIEKKFVREGIPMLNRFSDWFAKDGVRAIGNFEEKAVPFVKGVLSDTRDVLHDIAPYAKTIAHAFNSLPDGLKKTLGAGVAGGIVAKKLGLFGMLGSRKGGLGGGSGILGLLSRNKPIPVYVVNRGGGLGGGDLPGTVGKTGGKAAEKEAEALTKKGLKVGKLWLPIATAVVLGEAAHKYAPRVDPGGHETQSPITTWAVGKMKGFVDKREVEATTQALIRQGGRWAKVNDMLGIGRSSAEKLKDEVFDLGKKVDHVAGTKQTRFEAPNLLNLLDDVKRYGSWLDHLDGRTVRTHIESTITRNRIDEFGGRNGPRSPGVQIHIDKVEAHDYKDFTTQMQRRTRGRALDGIG